MGLERSRRDGVAEGVELGRAEGVELGRAEGVVEGRAEGVVEGRAENQRETIIALSAAFGIQLTDAQRASLDEPNTNLDEIVDVLIRERRWP
jgi:flagellar biosynthesis/type III secretory pathway protein FliH